MNQKVFSASSLAAAADTCSVPVPRRLVASELGTQKEPRAATGRELPRLRGSWEPVLAPPGPRGHVGAGTALPAGRHVRVTLARPLCAVPLPSVVPHMHFDVQFLEKFGVTFRREGETVTLKCTLLVTPDLKRVQPRAEWYRDGECMRPPAGPRRGPR